jgi:hypothetical protein
VEARCLSRAASVAYDARVYPPRAVLLMLAVVLLAACGGPGAQPRRGVLEHDVDGWSYRRFQQLLDVEVWVSGNAAIAYAASYADRGAERRGRIGPGDVVSAVVTRYRRDVGIDRALIEFVRRLARDSTYKVDEERLGGVRVFLVTGGGEAWALWAGRHHVVKVGGPGRNDVPADVVAAYGARYPSRLESGALEGPLPPAGDDAAPVASPVPSGEARRARAPAR